MEDFAVDFASLKDHGARAGALLKEYGVLVVRGVFGAAECTAHMRKLVYDVQTVFPELQADWNDANGPPGPRSGLYQNLAGQLPTVWAVRTDPRVRAVFEAAYTVLRGKPVTDFATSCDGLNLRPYGAPFRTAATKDWAHLDQTTSPKFERDPFTCVQGQVVLSSSDACFVCSPKSVQVFEQLSALTRKNFARVSAKTGKAMQPSNWNLLRPEQYAYARAIVEAAGGAWQTPVRVPRGSMILWLSSTVHSARIQAEIPAPVPTPADPFLGWRGVVYVCFRPKKEVTDAHLKRLQKCVDENRCTNHWGERLFGTSYFRRKASDRVLAYLKAPHKVYEDFPALRPKWTPALRALCFRRVRPLFQLSPAAAAAVEKPVQTATTTCEGSTNPCGPCGKL